MLQVDGDVEIHGGVRGKGHSVRFPNHRQHQNAKSYRQSGNLAPPVPGGNSRTVTVTGKVVT